jgi:murein DD-endopeptidase MepM/ murein hydrolase activator NlpD
MPVIDRNRHAPTGRFRAPRLREQSRGLPQVYAGRARRSIRDIYEVDHAHGGRNKFRWLVSTCLAATVGTIAIGVVLYGSLNRNLVTDSVLEQLSTVQQPTPTPLRLSVLDDGLNWTIPKSNRLYIASSALTARYTIHEQVQVRRNNRPFIQIRPYLRISMRLVPASPANRDVIPPFNPFKLYAASALSEDEDAKEAADIRQGHVKARVVELLGGILPGNDGQELDTEEVSALIREARSSVETDEPQPALEQVGVLPGNLTPAYLAPSQQTGNQSSIADATTVIRRTVARSETEDAGSDRSEIRVERIGNPIALIGVLRRMGATSWQSRSMVDAAEAIYKSKILPKGHEVRARLVPHADRMEPEAFAIFGPLNQHLVTVKRNEDGVFVATAEFDPRILMTRTSFDEAEASDASLYASIYDAALIQKLPPDEIMKILRIHAYEIDFRRRVRDGDQLELFYELKTDADGTNEPGELLYAAITSGDEKLKFWRFRSQDGAVEYYAEDGENSKKFLMRKPVRGGNVRLTSGFGYRRHPLHGDRRMHTGADWAAPYGTPILAAGRGVIEVAQRKGAYGNYVRIKHANGYQTAYGHMQRFSPAARVGAKIRQGQVIGYVGSTGLSSGPHLHYEILVNKRFVDPLKIRVPRSRKLQAKELAAFHRERHRIEQLLRRSPVRTASRSTQ